MFKCEWCGGDTDEETFIINFGICDPCFDASWEQYTEESAGPFDWVVTP